MNKLKRRLAKSIRRTIRTTNFKLGALLVLCCLCILGYAVYMDNRRLSVDTASTKPLLELIAQAESKGNYNAYFGSANNTSIRFTDMTIAQVQDWQAAHIAGGHASSAVGRYQIIDTTLNELVKRLHLDTTHTFDQEMQDRLAVALLEQRGSVELVNKKLSKEEFGANLAKEWAALPRIAGANPEASYYDGDGLNSALVSTQDILQAITHIKPQ